MIETMIGTKIRYLPIPNALTPHNPPFAPIRIVQPNHHRLPIFVSILVPIIVAPILVPIIVPIIGSFNPKRVPCISRSPIGNPLINPEAPLQGRCGGCRPAFSHRRWDHRVAGARTACHAVDQMRIANGVGQDCRSSRHAMDPLVRRRLSTSSVNGVLCRLCRSRTISCRLW